MKNYCPPTYSRPPRPLATLALLLATGAAQAQTPASFAAVSTYSTDVGSRPIGIAVADVNGDGRLDLVTVGNYGGPPSAAWVLLGQAGGGFAAVSLYSTGAGSNPSSIAVGDVNGDGRLDLVTANEGSGTAGVLLNTGTFTPLAAAPGAGAAEVALFPNPARGSFSVQLLAAWGTAPTRAELRNALGQVVAVRTAAAGGAALHFATGSLAPGVYVLRVQTGGRALVKRVVLD